MSNGKIKCPDCDGNGYDYIRDGLRKRSCPACGGTGEVSDMTPVTTVPSSVVTIERLNKIIKHRDDVLAKAYKGFRDCDTTPEDVLDLVEKDMIPDDFRVNVRCKHSEEYEEVSYSDADPDMERDDVIKNYFDALKPGEKMLYCLRAWAGEGDSDE